MIQILSVVIIPLRLTASRLTGSTSVMRLRRQPPHETPAAVAAVPAAAAMAPAAAVIPAAPHHRRRQHIPVSQSDASGETDEKFTDLVGFEWARDAVYTLNERGIILGTSDTTFSPQENIKRGDYMLILSRMMEINDAFTENFADIPADSYYYNAIGSARAAGVAQGDGEYFYPEDAITREDLITLAYRDFAGARTDCGDRGLYFVRSVQRQRYDLGLCTGADGCHGCTGDYPGLGRRRGQPAWTGDQSRVAVMCARILNLLS